MPSAQEFAVTTATVAFALLLTIGAIKWGVRKNVPLLRDLAI